ncbi:EamA family transporter [Candidatus Poribacteria bacterium]
MIFLILQILLLSSFGLVTKHYQALGRNMLAVGFINYAFAAFVAGLSVVYKRSFDFDYATCIIGVLAGIFYFTAFFLMITTVKFSGISITWSAIRLSVLVPILFSILYWNESPSIYQILGICLVCISLLLLSIRPGIGYSRRIFSRVSILVLALFIAAGGVNLAPKAFSEISPENHRHMYLLFLFSTAALASGLALLPGKVKPKTVDISYGIALGLCNILARYFLLLALERLPGIVVFPISGSMSIVLMTIAGMVIWHERTRTLNMAGIVSAVVSVVLVNLR